MSPRRSAIVITDDDAIILDDEDDDNAEEDNNNKDDARPHPCPVAMATIPTSSTDIPVFIVEDIVRPALSKRDSLRAIID